MIIEVRPTSAVRRHRARIAGTVVGAAMLAASLVSVAEIAFAPDPGQQPTPYSDPAQP